MRRVENQSAFLPSLGVLVAGGLWGLFWLPLQVVEAKGVSGDWVNLLLFSVSGATTLPWALRGKKLGIRTKEQLITGILIGAAFALYTLSLMETHVVSAILLFYMTPVWSTLASVIFWGGRLTNRRVVALSLGLSGLWLAIQNDHGLPVPQNWGDWVALLAGLCWSAGTLRSFHGPPLPVSCTVLGFSTGGLGATLVIMVLRYLAGEVSTDLAAVADTMPLILTLGVCLFTIPNLFVMWAAQRLEPARLGILLLAEVLTGVISAAVFSAEPFGVAQMLGSLLVVAAGIVEVTARSEVASSNPRPKRKFEAY